MRPLPVSPTSATTITDQFRPDGRMPGWWRRFVGPSQYDDPMIVNVSDDARSFVRSCGHVVPADSTDPWRLGNDHPPRRRDHWTRHETAYRSPPDESLNVGDFDRGVGLPETVNVGLRKWQRPHPWAYWNDCAYQW